MITLIQFPKPKDRPSFSPFCLKLESYLRVAKVPYENKLTVSMNGSTKKKMPMILDDGRLVEDSMLVIAYLKEKHGVDLDKHLTPEQKGIAKAYQWLCERSMADVIVHFRWADVKNWPKFREVIFRGAPWFIKMTVANVMSKSIKKTLYKSGTGRFTDKEKLEMLDQNLAAISNYLGEKNYFFGDQVSAIDTIIYSHLVQARPRNIVPQFSGMIEKYPNLIKYLARFSKTYWPEFKGEEQPKN